MASHCARSWILKWGRENGRSDTGSEVLVHKLTPRNKEKNEIKMEGGDDGGRLGGGVRDEG